MPAALAVMTRSTSDPRIKSRLAESVPLVDDRRELALAFLDDLIDRGQALPGVRVRVAVTPPLEGLRVDRPSLPADLFLPQRGTSVAERQRHVFEDLAASGFGQVVLICGSVPDLPTDHLLRAFAALSESSAMAVVGPSESGACYLIGLTVERGAVPDVFSGVRWDSPYAAEDFARVCEQGGRTVRRIDAWNDVASPSDLESLTNRLRYAPDSARHTAAALKTLKRL